MDITTMINYLLTQFDLHHKLYQNVLADFSDEETNQRLYDDKKMNHIKYLAGHLLNAQYGLAEIAGAGFEVKWNALFAAAGQSEAKDDIIYPHIDEIKSEWNKLYEKTRGGLEKLTPEALEKEAPYEFFNSVGEMWAFLSHHQAYHIGQIGILRRGFGKEPMRYD
jgi:uncharacterized damage-inducible protein DinB